MTLLAVTAVSGLFIARGASSGLAGDAFTKLGAMSMQGADSAATLHLVVDPQIQRGFMILKLQPPVVRVYDTAAMRALKDVPGPPQPGAYLGDDASGAPRPVLDQADHKLIYVATLGVPTTCPLGSTSTALALLDELTLHWSFLPLPCSPNGHGLDVETITWDTTDSALFILGRDALVDNYSNEGVTVPHYLVRMDVHGKGVSWTTTVPPCTGSWTNGPAFLPTALLTVRNGNAAIVCTTNGGSRARETLVTIPLRPGASAPAVDGQGNPLTVRQAPLVGNFFGVAADAGSSLIAEISIQQAYGYGAYIVDANTMLFRGKIVTAYDTSVINSKDAPTAVGLDSGLGRLYLRTQTALVVTDLRNQPLPVGLAYSDSGLPDKFDWQHNTRNQIWIETDSVRHRLYMPDYTTNSILVYQDNVPATAAALPGNPDGATTNLVEAPGKTGAVFSGAGDAAGLSILSVGGPSRPVQNVTQDCPWDSSDFPFGQLECPEDKAVNPGDRRLLFAHVPQLVLTNVGAEGAATVADYTDAATEKDLDGTDAYQMNTGSPSATPGPGWTDVVAGLGQPAARFPVDRPVDRPHCSDYGAAASTDGERNAAGTSTVTCDLDHLSVSGESDFNPTASLGPVQVGRYHADAASTKDSTGQGEVTTVAAEADSVVLAVPGGPSISIASIQSSASAAAHGRPGTTAAHYSRAIEGVVTPSYQCSTNCDPQAVADAITASFHSMGISVSAYVPSAFLQATPGGYQAVVSKNPDLYASDRAVNDDISDTVPGLELVYYGDGAAGPTREVVDFAAVHAEAHYGIFSLDQGPSDSPSVPPSFGVDTPQAVSAGVTPPSGGPGGIPSPRGRSQGPTGIPAVLRHLADIVEETWRLLVTDPKTAAALAGLWALLFTPVYLAMRRRALLRGINKGAA